MTFFGPWEADVERHLYNYKSPFAQTVMGMIVGDETELIVVDPPGRYRLERIGNPLSS